MNKVERMVVADGPDAADSSAKRAGELIDLVRDRTENAFDAGKLCCSESILFVLNQGFGGGLTSEDAISLGAGLCGGMGGAGCVCGALSGATVCLGMFLGPGRADGLRKKKFRQVVKELHDRFRELFGATCCRVLTEKVRHNRNCRRLTGITAALLASLLLEARPDLAGRADMGFLQSRDKRAGAAVRNFFRRKKGNP